MTIHTFSSETAAGSTLPSDSPARPEISDPQKAEGRWFTRWAAPYLNDARDVVFIGLMMESVLVGVVAALAWFSSVPLWLLTPLYLLGLLWWALDRFTLMLHCTSHRPLFKARYRAFNKLIPWFFGPIFGHTPNTYFAHHMGMHHREENLEADLSATIYFKRDRLDHWLRYYLRFLFFGLFELGLYFARRKRFKMLGNIVVGEAVYWTLVAILAWFRPAQTLVVVVGPMIFIRTLMMMGNWGQHAFVSQDHPEDPYQASITCINTRYNRRCFNDGYHVLHHIKASCHWTEHPGEFKKDIRNYGKHDSIVFDGLDFFQVWACLMLRRWSILAAHFVSLPEAPRRTQAEVIEFLKSRVQPLERRPV